MQVLLGDTRAKELVEIIRTRGWGRMYASPRVPRPFEGEPWGFDNGAYTAWTEGRGFPADTFRTRVDAVYNRIERGESPPPYIAVLPDLVAGGLHSLEFSLMWLEQLPRAWRWYLAVQDGMTAADVEPELGVVAGLLLGGTTRFKSTAGLWRTLAHSYGLRFHYARAGTPNRLQHAFAVQADSIDSAFPLWERPRLLEFIAALQAPRSPALPLVQAWLGTAGMYQYDPLTGCAP